MKSNNQTSIILLICALVAGGAGWYLSQNYINTKITSYKTNFEAERQAVLVVVATKDLKIGDVIDTNTAAVRQIPKSYVPSEALSPDEFGLIQGKRLVHPVRSGDPILKYSVSQVKVAGLASLLKEGERAITIPVSSLDTLSGFLKPGDYIDLMITLKDGAEKRTVPLAQDLRVLATGSDLDDGIPETRHSGNVTQITLGVTPLMASRLIYAQSAGDISVLLRKPDDSDRFNDYVTIDNLVDIPQKQKTAPPPAPKSPWGFELIKGGKRS